jgi:hypothetical protein
VLAGGSERRESASWVRQEPILPTETEGMMQEKSTQIQDTSKQAAAARHQKFASMNRHQRRAHLAVEKKAAKKRIADAKLKAVQAEP